MKKLGTLVLGLLVVTTIGAEEKKPDFDAAKLVGNWTYVSGKKAGDDVGKDSLAGTVTFTKDTVTVPAGPDSKFLMTYTIDTKTTPATIDLTIKEAPVKEIVGGKAQGILSITGDELKFAYVDVSMKDAAKRPTKFESTKENKAFYFVLKKAK